ncbi:hypothetical protein KI387_012218, partial [Taxus chinensis]
MGNEEVECDVSSEEDAYDIVDFEASVEGSVEDDEEVDDRLFPSPRQSLAVTKNAQGSVGIIVDLCNIMPLATLFDMQIETLIIFDRVDQVANNDLDIKEMPI